MKLVLYRGNDEIIDIIEDSGDVQYDRKTRCLSYKDGEFVGLNCKFAVLEDDEPVDAETLLAYQKKMKIEELNEACKNEILAGFYCTATDHYYGFDEYDQMNFIQQHVHFVCNPDEESVNWKTEDAGIINHTRDDFLEVCDAALAHKCGNIAQYWALKTKVEAASSCEEVEAIQWAPWLAEK